MAVKARGFVAKMRSTIDRYRMIAPGDVVLVGVSGGPDSVALLHALVSLREELGFSVCVGHLNHGLRGADAEEDARFAQDLASRWGLGAVVECADVAAIAARERMSIELAARVARYEFFERAARSVGATRVALGHHANDQAETVLMRLIRGAGATGLGGIPPIRPIERRERSEGPILIRPLIAHTRQEISRYCEEHDLRPRTDASNLVSEYTRNRVRNELIPLLEERYNPRVVETLARAAELVREDDEYLAAEVERRLSRFVKAASEERVVVDARALAAEHVAAARRVLRWAISRLAPGGEGFEFEHVENLLELARRDGAGASVDLPRGLRASRGYGELVIERWSQPSPGPSPPFERELAVPGATPVPEAHVEIEAEVLEPRDPSGFLSHVRSASRNEAYFDLDEVGHELIVRSRREGDRILPLGMAGSRKLKDILIDEKVPRNARGSVPVIVSRRGVLWVAGFRTSRVARVTPETRRVLHLTVRPLDVR